MTPVARVLAAAAVFALAPSLAQAKVKIAVDLDAQTIHVEDKDKTYDWKISSGKDGYETPAGTFKVLWMDKDHHSDTYEQAPMPNAIFFAPGYAIHGASKSQWGRPASHGCVRIPVAKSALLFDMVKAEGGTAEITITGYSPVVAPTVASVNAKHREQAADPYAQTPYAQDPYADGYQPPIAPRRGSDDALYNGLY